MGERRAISMIGVILILSSLIFLTILPYGSTGIPTGPNAPMDPTIWLDTERNTYVINVEPGHVDQVPIFGTLYCEFATGTPPGTKIYVDLEILSSVDYKGTVMHTFVKGQEEEPVEFRIDLPDMTAARSNLDYHLTFYPNWYNIAANRQGMGEVHTVNIDPLPYGATLITPPTSQIFNVGDSHGIDIEIKNRGNCEAKYSVNVEAEGLELAVPNMIMIIPPGRIEVYPILVKQKSGLGKEGYIKVTAKSEVKGDFDTDKVEIHWETRSKLSNVILNPITLIISFTMIITITLMMVFLMKKIKKRKRRHIN